MNTIKYESKVCTITADRALDLAIKYAEDRDCPNDRLIEVAKRMYDFLMGESTCFIKKVAD